MSPTAHVLVADDQPHVREALRLLLKGEGYAIETAVSPAAVLSAVQASDFDAVLLDLNYARDTTTGREGLELVSQLQALDATLPTVVMTAWGSVEKAVEAMRRGARDFIEKPWDNNRLLATLRTQVELGRALRNTQRLETENRLLRRDGAPELIAQSAVMRPVLQLMDRVAASDANVLISGEHGTGKEVVAQWLHGASPRAARPLVAVNLGGLSEGLFESEMFGHVKGAFTDARTDGSSSPREAPSCWTRSERWACASRRSCSGCWRPARWSGWVRRAPAGSTCAFCRPPTRIFRPR